jgi:hypothetical protein
MRRIVGTARPSSEQPAQQRAPSFSFSSPDGGTPSSARPQPPARVLNAYAFCKPESDRDSAKPANSFKSLPLTHAKPSIKPPPIFLLAFPFFFRNPSRHRSSPPPPPLPLGQARAQGRNATPSPPFRYPPIPPAPPPSLTPFSPSAGPHSHRDFSSEIAGDRHLHPHVAVERGRKRRFQGDLRDRREELNVVIYFAATGDRRSTATVDIRAPPPSPADFLR